MDLKEFAGYAAGTLVTLALLAGVVAVVGMAIAMIPVLLVIAPMTVIAVAIVVLIGWRRHRRTTHKSTDKGSDG
jgi:Flp pilus assembly protein TadB